MKLYDLKVILMSIHKYVFMEIASTKHCDLKAILMSIHNIYFYGNGLQEALQSRGGDSNGYQQHMFLWITGENHPLP